MAIKAQMERVGQQKKSTTDKHAATIPRGLHNISLGMVTSSYHFYLHKPSSVGLSQQPL